MASPTKTVTIRLPIELYETSSAIAKRRRVSLNSLVQEGLNAIKQADENARLYEAFGELGEDGEECDVEFAMPAQCEVVRRADP